MGDFEDFSQAVGDEDDSLSCRSESSDGPEKAGNVVLADGGGRLVEDQDGRAAVRERLGDFHQLAGGDAEVPHLHGRASLATDGPEEFGGLAIEPREIHESKTPRLGAQKYVLGDGEVQDRAEFLLDDGDAAVECVYRARKTNGRAINADFAGIRLEEAHEYVERCGFARTVAAAERVYFASVQFQATVYESGRARK